jgi:uncharacterized protein YydD (DUF2326 family)
VDKTTIDTVEDAVIKLFQDIADIKAQSASKLADGNTLETHVEYGCVIETSLFHGRFVMKIQIHDADLGVERPFYIRCLVNSLTRKQDRRLYETLADVGSKARGWMPSSCSPSGAK